MKKPIILILIILLISSLFITPPTAKATLYTVARLYAVDRSTYGGGSTSAPFTLANAPTSGDTLIMTASLISGAAVRTITAITQVGVTWTNVQRSSHAASKLGAEIWIGVVGVGAVANGTATTSNADAIVIMNVGEYSCGLAVDLIAKHDTQSGASKVTGTLAAGSNVQDLLVGSIIASPSGTQTTPINGFTLIDGASFGGTSNAYLELLSAGTILSSGTTTAVNQGAGCIASFKITGGASAYNYTLSAKWENGTATTLTAIAIETGNSTTLSITGTPTTYYFTSQPLAFSWTVTGGNTRILEPTAATGTYVLTNAQNATTIFNIQFKDLANVFGAGSALLRISKIVVGTSTIITQFTVPDTLASNPAALIPSTAYTVDLIDYNGVTHALGNYIPFAGTTTQTFLLASPPFAGLAQWVQPYISSNITRPAPSTSITVNYNSSLTTYSTDWGRVQWKYRNLTVAHTIVSAGGNSISFNWAAASATTDYIVVLSVHNTFFGNVTKSFISLAPKTSPGVPSLAGLGTFGGVNPAYMIGICILLCFAGVATAWKPGAGAVGTVIVGALLAYYGWIGITETILMIALSFAVMYAMNEGRG